MCKCRLNRRRAELVFATPRLVGNRSGKPKFQAMQSSKRICWRRFSSPQINSLSYELVWYALSYSRRQYNLKTSRYSYLGVFWYFANVTLAGSLTWLGTARFEILNFLTMLCFLDHAGRVEKCQLQNQAIFRPGFLTRYQEIFLGSNIYKNWSGQDQ